MVSSKHSVVDSLDRLVGAGLLAGVLGMGISGSYELLARPRMPEIMQEEQQVLTAQERLPPGSDLDEAARHITDALAALRSSSAYQVSAAQYSADNHHYPPIADRIGEAGGMLLLGSFAYTVARAASSSRKRQRVT